MARKKTTKDVALAFPLAATHLARFIRGVTDYARQHGDWTFSACPATVSGFPETLDMTIKSLKGWPGDGVITVVATRAQAKAAGQLGVPVVNLAGALRDAGLPRVMVDHKATGQLAAAHLLDAGLKRFAYLGLKGVWYSQQRRDGFRDAIERAGGECLVYEVSKRTDFRQLWLRGQSEIDAWLRTLKPPVGILAVHDDRARLLVDGCRRVGLAVPHDVALMGVDNDETVCEFCQPPLTSVSRSSRRVGYEAAALLDRLMSGKPAPDSDLLVPPDGVVRRASTGIVAIEDPHVAAAVQYTRDHVDEMFGVERFEKLLPVSRRRIEQLFQRVLGQTPYEYICHVRVIRAKELLVREEKMAIRDVAAACGFPDTQRLRLVFQRLTGKTPTDYRQGLGR